MPELPDVVVYVECLNQRIRGATLEHVHLENAFVLRSVDPPATELAGKRVRGVSRLGKRIVIELEVELFIVVHLMIAGRFQWTDRGAKPFKRPVIARFEFTTGELALTEAGTKRRASVHFVRGVAALCAHDRGGLEVLESDAEEFASALRRENHTLKRALTDPTLFSGIGNAYSDEILHRARLSPMKLSQAISDEEARRLFDAARSTLLEWTDRLREEARTEFPKKVTAFREGMAVHGRFGEPCPVCGSPVQRIVYAANEANYCARCQTGGNLLADRALSRLMKQDWPRSLDELEERRREARDADPDTRT